MPAKRDVKLLDCICRNASGGKWLVPAQKFYEKTGMEDEEQIRLALNSLRLGGFIDVLYTDRHGEPFIYLTVTQKANDFLSAKSRRRKELAARLSLAVLSALVTYVAGKILYALFT